MRIITISREFGSGGRELGKRLADYMGYDYYDSEIIAAVAENVTFENITVTNSKCADYQYYAGGIAGWVSGDNNKFINCNIRLSVLPAGKSSSVTPPSPKTFCSFCLSVPTSIRTISPCSPNGQMS